MKDSIMKDTIRKEILSLRESQSPDQVMIKSQKIKEQLE